MGRSLGVLGCGKMARAILTGLNRHPGIFDSINLYDIQKSSSEQFARDFGARVCNPPELVKVSDVVLVAVKPYQVECLLRDIAAAWQLDKLLISVAAGIKTSSMEKILLQGAKVVRVMPNTPALVGKGMSAICCGQAAKPSDSDLVLDIFNTIGKAVLVDEKYMDAVTAVSGSGPAYVFMVVEAMINAAVYTGLDLNLARELVLQTMQGSLAMIEETGFHPAKLREDVCSPGGTTIAAVRKLEDNGLRTAFFAAIEAAWLKSKELGRD
ncbi:pyrroline-5-carboxylate reductase [Syntrophomonas palmitatica]|uniref:pyrroline-5-carboxylate reductase n=1 Tax=Syntrophomonas palmitatica TaxID=402877 RepID=UPI0006D079E3|nr:pyrroline-5-carboxylate reductase [Syntrophomonas palmitatica]